MGPHSGNGFGYIPFHFLLRDLWHGAANAIQYLKSRLSFSNEPLVHLNGNDGYHRPARAFHNDRLLAVVNATQQMSEVVTRFPCPHTHS